MENKDLEMWAVVEVMGHNTYAGKLSEQTLAGTGFIRVDVPAIPPTQHRYLGHEGKPAFTKLIGPGSIYAITPCSEEVARKTAAATRSEPLTMVSIPVLQGAIEASAELSADEDENEVPY